MMFINFWHAAALGEQDAVDKTLDLYLSHG